MPVGRCVSETDEFVLLMACPPGPRPLTNRSSRSDSSRVKVRVYESKRFSFLMEVGRRGRLSRGYKISA